VSKILRNTNAAFTLNGFDDQERNLTFVKTDFQVLKLKFYSYNFKKAFYPLHKLDKTKVLLYKLFVRYLVVKPACVNAALVSICFKTVFYLYFDQKHSYGQNVDFYPIRTPLPPNWTSMGV